MKTSGAVPPRAWMDRLLAGDTRMERRALWILVAGLAWLYFAHIGIYGFIGPDEPRYARIAQEMMERSDWVVPTLTGSPWLEKPPLAYWGMILSYRLLGVSEFSARVPSALCALGTALLLFWAVRPTFGFVRAWLTALTLGTAALFIGFAGAGSTDMPVTFCTTAGLLFLWRGLLADAKHPTLFMVASGIFLGLGTLAKGPIAIVIPALALYPFLLFEGDGRRFLRPRLLLGLAALLAVSLPWYILIYQRQGFHFLLVFFINHHVARYLTPIHHHTQPIYYYITVTVLGLLPWTLFLPHSLAPRRILAWIRETRGSEQSASMVFFLGWLLLPFLFFSFSTAKLPGYILPLFPALAFLAATGAETFLREGGPIPKWYLGLAVMVALVLGAGLPIFTWIRFQETGLGILMAALVLPGIIPFAWLGRKGKRPLAVACLSLAVLLPVGAGSFVLFPRLEPYFSYRLLSQEALKLAGPGNPLVVYRNFHHTTNYYTHYTCTRSFPNPQELLAHLAGRTSPVYVLADDDGRGELLVLQGWKATLVRAAGGNYLFRLDRVSSGAPHALP